MLTRVRRLLAIDLGAESGRVVLGSLADGVLAIEELARFPNTPLTLDGTLRWNMDALCGGIQSGCAAAAAAGAAVESIGVDAWGCDYGLVDAQGALLEPPYHYRDHRTDGVMARVLARVGRDRIYETTGVQCLPFNTLYQLVAARERSPRLLESAARLLTIPDVINRWLTGRMVCEFTNATTTQCLDARTGAWATDLLDALNLPRALFGAIVRPGTIIGRLDEAVLPGLGGPPVVAPACHDTGSAFAAVESGGDTAILSCGTWSLLGTEVSAPVISAASRDLNFTNEGGVDGTFRLLKNIGGLWLLQACRRTWEQAGTPWSYHALVAAAAAEPSGLRTLLDPDDPAFLNPGDMVAAIARYAERTRQPVPDGPAGYARAILESLALKYRMVLDALEAICGRSFRTIRIVGGGSQNRLLCRFTADATGRTVLAGPVEATALGNLAVQLVATGAVASLPEARRVIERSFPPVRYDPERSPAWDEALRRFHEHAG
jgi:rhamnulokinase